MLSLIVASQGFSPKPTGCVTEAGMKEVPLARPDRRMPTALARPDAQREAV